MFLKNVPPVVALHTEWRSYGPTRNFSLPLCFNDSDSDISTAGTPVPEKVQMIIDSLRSTESSIDMSDEYEGTLQTGKAPSPGCTSKTVDVVHKARRRGTMGGTRQDNKNVDSMEFDIQSQDSDSDDSVDRGIEEAIQEYLKKKDDHKRKLEPTVSPSQVPKHPKNERPLSDIPKNLDSNIILTASIPKGVKTTHSVVMERKRIRNARPSEENPLLLKKRDIIKAVKTSPSFETNKCHIDPSSHSYKGQNLSTCELEKESPDSSSDDGIEEAIRHYQLEKINENSEDFKKPCKFLQPNEESDSSSDDGIEEAIRCYQLEKQKEESKHVIKASKNSQPKQTHGSKAPSLCLDHSATQVVKKQKVFTKKRKTERNSKPILSTPVASCHTLSKSLDSPDIKDNGISFTRNKIPSEQPTPAPLKVNTTAELMCAEAILDISKAVMPEAFAALPDSCVQSTFHSQDRMNCVENKTDESSIDSDDGIEQEIRKFLELKAQMHSQSSGTTNVPGTQEHAMSPQEKRKAEPSQNKSLRLSLSRKRKRKEEDGNIYKAVVLDSKSKVEHCPQHLAVHDNNNTLRTQTGPSKETGVALHVATTASIEGPTKNSERKHTSVTLKDAKDLGREGDSHRASLKNEVTKSLMLAERRSQTGDKSSSLDSDEDLDAAIKDLLLTKKKVKRKTRDRKSKKCVQFGSVELCLVEDLDSAKKKTPLDCKTVPNPKITKSCISKSSKVTPKQNTNGRSMKPKLGKNTSEQLKANKQEKQSCQLEQIGQKKGDTDVQVLSSCSHLGTTLVEEDSSSVDSDDSIEQEIRKFLAEKAKLSMVRTKNGEEMKDGCNNPTDSMAKEGIKMEAQQAEIPLTTENLYEGLPYCDVSGQPGYWEREVIKSTSLGFDSHCPQSADKGLSSSVASTSYSPSSLQPDKEVNTVKAMRTSRVSLDKSKTEKTSPSMEMVISVPEISPVSFSYKAGNISTSQATLPLTEFGVPVSQSLFHFSPPTRVREGHVTNISDLHALPHEISDTVCPAAGKHENVNEAEFVVPFPQSPKTYVAAIPSVATPAPAREADEDFPSVEARRDSLGQNSAPFPPGNVMHTKMDHPLFLHELSSREGNYAEIKSRDMSKGGDRKDCTRGREESQREGGDLVREGYEECIDETGDESEESPSGSQRSRVKKQFPRLILSTTIDPGESFRPYIILNSGERTMRYSRRSTFLEDQRIQSRTMTLRAATQKQVSQKGPEKIHPNYGVNVKTFYSRISPRTLPLPKKEEKKKLVKRKLQFYK